MAQQGRKWQLDGEPWYEDEGDELQMALMEASVILRRVGGAITVVADRREVAPEMYVTDRYLFQWHSYVPARRLQEVEHEAAAEPEPDPVAA